MVSWVMQYSDHFREVTKQRLIRLVLAGSFAGIALDVVLCFAGIPRVMPYVALGILVILLAALFDWYDFNSGIFHRRK
jgi:hypothetical protein